MAQQIAFFNNRKNKLHTWEWYLFRSMSPEDLVLVALHRMSSLRRVRGTSTEVLQERHNRLRLYAPYRHTLGCARHHCPSWLQGLRALSPPLPSWLGQGSTKWTKPLKRTPESSPTACKHRLRQSYIRRSVGPSGDKEGLQGPEGRVKWLECPSLQFCSAETTPQGSVLQCTARLKAPFGWEV